MSILPNKMTPPNFMVVHAPCIFHGLSSIFSLIGIQAETAECPAVLASLHVNMIQCNEPILPVRERDQGQFSGYHPMTFGGQVALRKHLKRPLLWVQIDFVSQWYEIYWKKHLLNSVQHGALLWWGPSHLRWWHCWAQPHGWVHYLVQFSVAHGHQPWVIWLFTSHTGLLKALWAEFTMHTPWSSCRVSPVSLWPQAIYFLWQSLFMGVVGRHTCSPLVFLLSSGLITLTQRQNSW